MTITVRFCAKHHQSPCQECDRAEAIGTVDMVLDVLRSIAGLAIAFFALLTAIHGEYAKATFWLIVAMAMRLEQFAVLQQRRSGSASENHA